MKRCCRLGLGPLSAGSDIECRIWRAIRVDSQHAASWCPTIVVEGPHHDNFVVQHCFGLFHRCVVGLVARDTLKTVLRMLWIDKVLYTQAYRNRKRYFS